MREVLFALEDDLVSLGWLRQIMKYALPNKPKDDDLLAVVLHRLLHEGVEIGHATDVGGHVKFAAWNGTVETRIDRAFREMETARQVEGEDDWAFWLCLRANVDEYEEC